MFEDIAEWIRAVFSNWVFLMSGIVSVALSIVSHIRKKTITGRIFFILGIFLLFVATFLSWRDEYNKVKAADESRPKFVLEIGRGIAKYGFHGNNTLVILTGRITNRGADSAVLDYRAVFQVGNSKTEISLSKLNGPIDFPLSKDAQITIRPEDVIADRTDKPIPKGGFVTGHFPFIIPGDRTSDLESGAATISVTISDYLGKEYSYIFRGTGPMKEMKFLSGEPIAPTTTPNK